MERQKVPRVQLNIRIEKGLSDRIDAYLERKRMHRHGDKGVFLSRLIFEGMNRREAAEKRAKGR